ncbi:hypothetical protein NAP1_05380 [Erythrobacter sp. NAP1]|nr:hypothetical protein NAP1_05380 [Erythrobacter sp. NAP1]
MAQLMPWIADKGNCVPQMFWLQIAPWLRQSADMFAQIAVQ